MAESLPRGRKTWSAFVIHYSAVDILRQKRRQARCTLRSFGKPFDELRAVLRIEP
jgi:hypothetical protein